MARSFGQSPSKYLGLTDDIDIIAFDLACQSRLQIHDFEEKKDVAQLNSLAYLAASAGEVLKFKDTEETQENEEIHIPTMQGLNGVEVW